MTRGLALAFAIAALVGPAAAQTRDGYNLWGKERIRFLYGQAQAHPGDARLKVRLAKALYDDGRRSEAESYLRAALALQPELAEAHCNLAVILQARAQRGDAEREFREALRLDSTLVEAMAGLGVLLCGSPQPAAGLAYLEKVVAVAPDGMVARYNLAVAYHQTGRLDQARASLEELLQRDPQYPGGRQALAAVHYSEGLKALEADRPREALASLAQARSYGATGEDLLFVEGLAWMRQRDYGRAEASFRALLAVRADHVPALRNLGLICEQTNRTQEALECYSRIRRLTEDSASP